MKAITLWQPWATLIAIYAKVWETRSFAPPSYLVGERIAIHAAARPVMQALQAAGVDNDTEFAMLEALQRAGLDFAKCPTGVLVCTARIAEVHRTTGDAPDRFGDYSEGRFAWKLTEVRQLSDMGKVRGRQRWFDVYIPGEDAA